MCRARWPGHVARMDIGLLGTAVCCIVVIWWSLGGKMLVGMMGRGCGPFVVRMKRHSEGGAPVCPANNTAQPQTCDSRKLYHILRDLTCLVTCHWLSGCHCQDTRNSGIFHLFMTYSTTLSVTQMVYADTIIRAFTWLSRLRRLALTAEALVQLQVNPCGICGGPSGIATGFASSTSDFLC